MTGLTIRRAVESDARAIAEIHYAGWQVAYAGIIAAEVMEKKRPEHRLVFWRARIADAEDLVLVAEDSNGAAQGFMHGGRALEHDVRNGSIAGYDCEIYSLHCRRAVHGQGLGRLLMAEAARRFEARGCRALMLWAFRDNAFRAFYPKIGGKLIAEGFDGEIPDVAYGWPVDALGRSAQEAAR